MRIHASREKHLDQHCNFKQGTNHTMNLRNAAFSMLKMGERLLRGSVPVEGPSLDSLDEFLVLFYDQALGTAIHATPLFEALRKARPSARITVASSGIALEVIRNNPFVDRVIETPNVYKHTLAAARVLRRTYRPGKIFCIITLNGSSRSRVALLAFLAGKSVRAGGTLAPALYHLPVDTSGAVSQIGKNLLLLTALGIQQSPIEPRLFFTQDDVNYVRTLLGLDNGLCKGIAMLVTRVSGGQPTTWPQDRFVAVARHLMETHGYRIVLPGTASDTYDLNMLAKRISDGAISLAGKTTVAQLAVLCALSDIAITLDTGGFHVARTQALPLVVIAPAWQQSEEWMPLGKPWARILKGPWFPAPPPSHYAIEEISVGEVIAAADELVSKFPPSPQAREARIARSLVPQSSEIQP